MGSEQRLRMRLESGEGKSRGSPPSREAWTPRPHLRTPLHPAASCSSSNSSPPPSSTSENRPPGTPPLILTTVNTGRPVNRYYISCGPRSIGTCLQSVSSTARAEFDGAQGRCGTSNAMHGARHHRFRSQAFNGHIFGQQGKKEYGFDNVKVANSAWDTNVISASTVRRPHLSRRPRTHPACALQRYVSLNWNSSGGGAFDILPLPSPFTPLPTSFPSKLPDVIPSPASTRLRQLRDAARCAGERTASRDATGERGGQVTW